MHIRTVVFAFSLLFLILLSNGSAQACQIRDLSFASKVLRPQGGGPHVVRYLVYLPDQWSAYRPYPVVYFLHGRNGDRWMFRDLGGCDRMRTLGSDFIVVAPDGENSYWMNGAISHEPWGDVVTQELIQDVESHLWVVKSPAGRLLAGISMGGHGALQLSLNHPGLFGAVAAHSPVFRTQEEANREFAYEFGQGEDYQWRDPFSLILIKNRTLTIPVYMDMGAQDPWLRNTKNMSELLRRTTGDFEDHVGEDAEGGHEMGYWRYHLDDYLRWYQSHLSLNP